MKKILFMSCAAAALMFASCASDEDVKMPAGNAISFANAFVNNSTRADITTADIENFGVYGYMDEVAGVVFNNEQVTKNGTWGYTNTQYWTAGHKYWFAAIAPFGAAEFTAPAALPGTTGEFGTLTYDNSKQLDLLYANQNNIAGLASGNKAVAFTFNHLLARTQFTFVNDATNANVKFQVSDVKITDGVKNASITLGENAKWSAADGDAGMELVYTTAATDIMKGGNLISGQQYMVPFAKAYNVTFTVDVYNGTVKVGSYDKTAVIPATVVMERGNSYNFTCSLTFDNVVEDAQPIEFTVTEVTEWTPFGETIINL